MTTNPERIIRLRRTNRGDAVARVAGAARDPAATRAADPGTRPA
jgi:hypothetical protein